MKEYEEGRGDTPHGPDVRVGVSPGALLDGARTLHRAAPIALLAISRSTPGSGLAMLAEKSAWRAA